MIDNHEVRVLKSGLADEMELDSAVVVGNPVKLRSPLWVCVHAVYLRVRQCGERMGLADLVPPG